MEGTAPPSRTMILLRSMVRWYDVRDGSRMSAVRQLITCSRLTYETRVGLGTSRSLTFLKMTKSDEPLSPVPRDCQSLQTTQIPSCFPGDISVRFRGEIPCRESDLAGRVCAEADRGAAIMIYTGAFPGRWPPPAYWRLHCVLSGAAICPHGRHPRSRPLERRYNRGGGNFTEYFYW